MSGLEPGWGSAASVSLTGFGFGVFGFLVLVVSCFRRCVRKRRKREAPAPSQVARGAFSSQLSSGWASLGSPPKTRHLFSTSPTETGLCFWSDLIKCAGVEIKLWPVVHLSWHRAALPALTRSLACITSVFVSLCCCNKLLSDIKYRRLTLVLLGSLKGSAGRRACHHTLVPSSVGAEDGVRLLKDCSETENRMRGCMCRTGGPLWPFTEEACQPQEEYRRQNQLHGSGSALVTQHPAPQPSWP